jgi:hypothetical protein
VGLWFITAFIGLILVAVFLLSLPDWPIGFVSFIQSWFKKKPKKLKLNSRFKILKRTEKKKFLEFSRT